MNRLRIGLAAASVFVASVLPATAAAPKMASHKMMASATLKCPSCGMPMPTKKMAAFPVPIKVGKKTYYCCSQCPSGKKAMAAMKMKPKAAAKKTM